MSKREIYRLIENKTGLPVAEVDGPKALNEIIHYYLLYKQDGPHSIQQKIDGKWIDWTITFENFRTG